MPPKRLVKTLLRSLTFFALLSAASATDYYVATTGLDTNPGTLAQPFRTIQHAAQVMVAGNTCYIRAGTYRETVTSVNSGTAAAPITYRPYASETVVISGAEVVSGWTAYTSNIYQAPIAGALGDEDQVFVDGRMMNLARWPNTTLDVSRPVKAVSASGTYNTTANADGTFTGTYTDPALTQAAGYFNGARIHALIGPTWVAETGVITDYQPGVINFHFYKRSGNNYLPVANDPYYIFGLLSLLDIPGEWFIDAGTKTLYLWPPQNDAPASHVVEVKRRDFGFELSNRAYINLQGLSFFACAINSSSSSDHLTLDTLSCLYLSHYAFSEAVSGSGFDPHVTDSGIVLNATYHILRNSHLAFSAGNGVTVLGSHHLVENCTIHDVDYLEVDGTAIHTGPRLTPSSDHEFRYNTCYNSGRELLSVSALIRGSVHHNDLYRAMLRTTDGGAIYTFNHDGQNTEIAYNRIRDNIAPDNGAVGLYLDGGVSNYHVHHNLVYNTWYGIEYNVNCLNILWYNNTILAYSKSFFGGVTGSETGSEAWNNIFTAAANFVTGLTQTNNLLSTVDPQFVSPATLDFRIQASSPAHDTGMVLSPYTDGYEGAAPDIGALEFAQTPWVSGSSLAANPPAGPTNLAAVPNGSAIQLSWNDNSSNETSFIVERSTDNRTYNELVRLPANATSYLDGAARRGYPYYYRVRADESAYSNYVLVAVPGHDAFSTIQGEWYDTQSGTVTITTTAPIVIGHCDAGQWVKYTGVNFGSGATQINLHLSSGSAASNNFLEVRLGSITGTRIANINVLSTGGYAVYTDLSIPITTVTGTQDLFMVFKGGSGVCNIDYFFFTPQGAGPAIPTPPTNVAASPASLSGVRLDWTAASGSPDGVQIERSSDNQTFLLVAVLSGTATTFSESGLNPGASVYYRLRAYNTSVSPPTRRWWRRWSPIRLPRRLPFSARTPSPCRPTPLIPVPAPPPWITWTAMSPW